MYSSLSVSLLFDAPSEDEESIPRKEDSLVTSGRSPCSEHLEYVLYKEIESELLLHMIIQRARL